MKYLSLLLLWASLLFSADSTLFQVATFSALMQGDYQGEFTYEELFKKGNFGLGTFDATEGEMVALDGQFYQDSPNGGLRKVQPSQTTPFAAVTFFKVVQGVKLMSSKNFAQLGKLLFPMIEQKNTPYAIRIDGTFRHLHLRSLRKQTPPFRPLIEAVKQQHEYDLYDIQGTLVGFYFPEYLNGVNVGGFHFHFISADKQVGGHVLDVSTKSASCKLQLCSNLEVHFPSDKEFSEANLEKDLNDIHQVEQGAYSGY